MRPKLTIVREPPAAIRRLRENVERLDTTEVADAIRGDVERSITAEQSPFGGGWAALAESTVKRHGGDSSFRFGRAVAADLDVQAREGGATVVVPGWGRYHQEGTDRMPARPFLPFSSSGAERIASSAWNAIKRALRDAIFKGVK